MYLHQDTAAKIIKEVSMILDYDINIMDEKGAILASTDPARVGSFHEGAFRIIRHELQELPVYEDGQYEGCRKGINLPICPKDKIIGVIGITGEVSEVMKYGKVLKKMTEILALDLFSYRQKSQQEQARLFLINEWINMEPIDLSPAFINELASYGCSEDSPYVVALVTPAAVLEGAEYLQQTRCLYAQNGDLGIVIFNTSDSTAAAGFVSKSAKNTECSDYLCVISAPSNGYTGVRHAYHQARKLLSIKAGKQGTFHYEDSVAELVFRDVSPEYKEILSKQILSAFSDEEKKDFADFMNVYVRCNGSVNAIASQLFVHKNTVQYKINKISRRTGRDPRLLKDVTILMMVAQWYRT